MSGGGDQPPRSDREPGPLHIADVLGTALRRLGVQREVREVQLKEAFAEVVGPALAPLCEALSLQRGTLLVATRNGALAQQLQLEMPTIVEGLSTRGWVGRGQARSFTALS